MSAPSSGPPIIFDAARRAARLSRAARRCPGADSLHVRASVSLASLTPDDVTVEVVYGRARDGDSLSDVAAVTLTPVDGQFEGTVPLDRAGSFGYTVRVTPRHALLASPAELGLVAVLN